MLEMRLSGNRHESSNLSVSARSNEITPINRMYSPINGGISMRYQLQVRKLYGADSRHLLSHKPEDIALVIRRHFSYIVRVHIRNIIIAAF